LANPEKDLNRPEAVELHNDIKTFHANTRKEWRRWLEKNHQSEKSVWLIIYHKDSETKSVYYEEAVEEAICFGWIDSIAHKRDEESKYQFFAQRKPKSNWSKANRERAEKMMRQGLMTTAGQKLIDQAKKTGAWEALVDVQNSVIPNDLQQRLNKNKTALKNFLAFPPSSKRIILEWILNAKKDETRQKRIAETVRLAAEGIKANHYRQ
jgi:uncharacterized protein YdeI (YjbR/CyaY-like superfamily)